MAHIIRGLSLMIYRSPVCCFRSYIIQFIDLSNTTCHIHCFFAFVPTIAHSHIILIIELSYTTYHIPFVAFAPTLVHSHIILFIDLSNTTCHIHFSFAFVLTLVHSHIILIIELSYTTYHTPFRRFRPHTRPLHYIAQLAGCTDHWHTETLSPYNLESVQCRKHTLCHLNQSLIV